MRKILWSGCLLLVLATQAMAQDSPKYEFFGGYGYVRPEGGKANLSGWHASVASNMNSWFGIAMELSGQYGSQTLSVANSSGVATSIKSSVDFHSLAFGPRVTYRKNERMSPFAHVLFGIARGNWKRPAIVAGEETTFAAAVGGGFDTKITDHVSFRMVQAEYVRTHFGATPQNNFRLATGFLFSF